MRKPRGKNITVSDDGNAKICTNCDKMLSLDLFHKSTTGTLGLYHICKKCRGIVDYQTYLKNKLKQGSLSIVKCKSCKLYMKRKADLKLCRRCKNV